jgi:hypothetical protein
MERSQRETGSTVELWDGRRYSRDWLDQNYPGLSDYADTHETLTELLPDSRRYALASLWKTGLAVTAVFDVIVILVSLSQSFSIADCAVALALMSALCLSAFVAMIPFALLVRSINLSMTKGIICNRVRL